MSSTLSTPFPLQPIGRTLRNVLMVVALLALVTVAFVAGRITVATDAVSAKVPTVKTAPAVTVSNACQPVAHYRVAPC